MKSIDLNRIECDLLRLYGEHQDLLRRVMQLEQAVLELAKREGPPWPDRPSRSANTGNGQPTIKEMIECLKKQ